MLYCPLLDDWILCRIGEKCGLTILVLVNAQSIMHIAFQIYDVLRFDSAVVIHVLINISLRKLNNHFFKTLNHNFEPQCINMLLG